MTGVILWKAAAAGLSDEHARKRLGWVLAAVLSPVILLAAVLCSMGGAESEHNTKTVSSVFYETSFSENVPAEFQTHVDDMKSAFRHLDSAVAAANSRMENGNSLDPLRVKAVFYALCFGEDAPSRSEADRFVLCFYVTEQTIRVQEITQSDGTVTRTEIPYVVAVPVSLSRAYENLSSLLGREITEADKSNSDHIYGMIAGTAGGSFDGSASRGDGSAVDLDLSGFRDPARKNAADLAAYAVNAWKNGWGYVWGTYGKVLTESALEYKAEQYPNGVGNHKEFIRANWLGGRTTDCVGLIKGYGWLCTDTGDIKYGTNGMPDVSANQMYHSASVSGPIGTMPDIPGIAVWHKGHIGVYIGGGEVIEAMNTKKGVVKTKLKGRGWTHWLKIPYISYS